MRRRDMLSTLAAGAAILLSPFKLFAKSSPRIRIMAIYQNGEEYRSIGPVSIYFSAINCIQIKQDQPTGRLVDDLKQVILRVYEDDELVEHWGLDEAETIRGSIQFKNFNLLLPVVDNNLNLRFNYPESIRSKYIKNPFLT